MFTFRKILRKKPDPTARQLRPGVDIVICVHNALEHVQRCIQALWATVDCPFNLILVDDGSETETAEWLKQLAAESGNIHLLRNEDGVGYTRAANQGLHAAHSDYIVLLNSDTEPVAGWLTRMIACAESHPRIGLVGPLSNAASYQSVPALRDQNGQWAVNRLPDGWSHSAMPLLLDRLTRRKHTYVPLLNGFCLLLKRAVVDKVGYFDESLFPDGYGEENDYAIRATNAGFRLAVCPGAYVYHAKSRSYGNAHREKLSQAGGRALVTRYGARLLQKKTRVFERNPLLQRLRAGLSRALAGSIPRASDFVSHADFRVLYLLPVKGFSGGAHSVIQDARGLNGVNVFAQVAIPRKYAALYYLNYPACPASLFWFYDDEADLKRYAPTFQVLVATIYTTVKLVEEIRQQAPKIVPAYYIQDYEPRFEPEGSSLHREALQSYTRIPDILGFAKTRWLRETVRKKHGMELSAVPPSLDRSLFHPPFVARDWTAKIRVAAMVRPNTWRRNASGTMQVLAEIAQRYRDEVIIEIFGCDSRNSHYRALPRDFPHKNHGILPQGRAASFLRQAHIFIDISHYQAFGRTALEAMASGCAVVLTCEGGVHDFAKDGVNCLLVSPDDSAQIIDAVTRLIEQREMACALGRAGEDTAKKYSIEGTSRVVRRLFADRLGSRDHLSGIAKPCEPGPGG